MKQTRKVGARPAHWLTRNIAIGGMVLLMIVLVLFNVRPRSSSSSSDPADTQQVARGQSIYRTYCASCHGTNLEGQPNWQQQRPDGTWPAPPHDETGHTWHHNDPSLFTIVKEGGQATAPAGYKSAMPGFGAVLRDEDVWAVLAYIKSTWSPETQAIQQTGHQ